MSRFQEGGRILYDTRRATSSHSSSNFLMIFSSPPLLDYDCFDAVLGRLVHPPPDHTANGGADQGCRPKQPELTYIRAACKQSRPGAARRINRRVGYRDRNEMDQCQSQANWNAGKAYGGTFGRGADDNKDEKESKQNFSREAGCEAVLPGLSSPKPFEAKPSATQPALPEAIIHSIPAAATAPITWAMM